jgi:outer membrane lipoprotein-sorting protein
MRTFCFFLLLLLLPLFAATGSATGAPADKDERAVAVLQQMAAATGWSGLNIPRDALATGIVTPLSGATSETTSLTVKARGARRSRFEAQASGGLRTTIINQGRGAVMRPEGTYFIPSYAAASLRPLLFPFFSDLTAADDPQVALAYLGTETVQGELAHVVEIMRESPGAAPSANPRRRPTRLVVWVSTVTSLPLQIEHNRVATDNPSAVRARRTLLSDYRAVGGLAMPFHHEESAGGQPLHTLQLTQVQFNLGLPDSDFELPPEPVEEEE